MRLIVIILLLLLPHTLLADEGKGVKKLSTDTLTAAQRMKIDTFGIASPFGYMSQLREASMQKDTARTEQLLMKIDPHYLMYLQQDPQTITAYLSSYTIGSKALLSYREKFYQAYKNRTETFKKMQDMLEEDRDLRQRVQFCGDSLTCAVAKRELRNMSHLHAAYLHRFVEKGGWPSMKDGALFAAALTLKDPERQDFYLPYVKDAVLKGDAQLETYDLLRYWAEHPYQQKFRAFLDTARKISVDIGSVLYFNMPINIQEVGFLVKDNCAQMKNLLIVYEAKDHQQFIDWVTHAGMNGMGEDHIISRVRNELREYCPGKILQNDARVDYLKSDQAKPRITLHIVY